MFDLILVVLALGIVIGLLELKQRWAKPAEEQVEEEPVQSVTVPELNKRELNEDFIERALWIAGHAIAGADVFQEGGSIIVKYADGVGYKVSLFASSKLRQPKRRHARDVVKRDNAQRVTKQQIADDVPGGINPDGTVAWH